MTADQVLIGVGLTLVLAVGSQVLAGRLRIPAIIVLLPVGFVAGALTDDVHPDRLLGDAFQPLVSLSVSVILYDAALELDLARLRGHTRRTVVRLIGVGVLISWGAATVAAVSVMDLSWRAGFMLGAIVVVSGPTVVGPLLRFVRPRERLQHILAWEGSLIDPVGGLLAAVAFHTVTSTTVRHELGHQVAHFGLSLGVGLAGGTAGTALLWLLLRRLELAEVMGSTAQLAAVVAVAAACNVVSEDSGLVSAIVMGLAVANLRGFDIPARRPFFATLVQLILGLLFVSISSTVAPGSLPGLVLPTLGLVAVLVLVVRPLVAAVSTVGTDLTRGERAFVGWMAPRGIVAAATASAFTDTLVDAGVGGAAEILPATFLVIVATVTLYGLTALPVARLLGVTRPARTRPLLVGGEPWVIALARALRAAGLDVLMWAAPEERRQAIRRAGLELVPGELIAQATGSGARIEGVTAVLLLTAEDDFNALAATLLAGSVEGPVYRVAPPSERHGVVAPYTGGETLFDADLTRPAVTRRAEAGAAVVVRPGDEPIPEGHDLLFVVRTDGRLAPVTREGAPSAGAGDTLVLLGPASAADVGARSHSRSE